MGRVWAARRTARPNGRSIRRASLELEESVGVPTVTFANTGRSCEAREGATLLVASNASASPLATYCAANAMCGTCAVVLVKGELSEPTVTEGHFIDAWGFEPGYRLGCQARVIEDVSVISCGDEGHDRERIAALAAQLRGQA
jgi:ferredoxin